MANPKSATSKTTDIVTVILSHERLRARPALQPIAEAVFAIVPSCPKIVVTECIGLPLLVVDVGSIAEQYRSMLVQALEGVRPLGMEIELLPAAPKVKAADVAQSAAE